VRLERLERLALERLATERLPAHRLLCSVVDCQLTCCCALLLSGSSHAVCCLPARMLSSHMLCWTAVTLRELEADRSLLALLCYLLVSLVR
jgi:hypothetical protein